MSKLSLKQGRVSQKQETRNSILQSARAMLAAGRNVSLEHVAREAGISRATIYRYFSDIDVLVTEASLDVHHRSPEELVEEISGMSLPDRLFYLQHYYNQLAIDKEPLFRRYLSAVIKASVNTKQSLRGARRVKALEAAMKPYKREFTKKDYAQLRDITALLTGIDALVTARDVTGRSATESQELTRWALEMILKGMAVEDPSDPE